MKIKFKDVEMELTPEEYREIFRTNPLLKPEVIETEIEKRPDKERKRSITLDQIKTIKELQLEYPDLKDHILHKKIIQRFPSWKITRSQVRYWMLNTPKELKM